MRLERAAIPAGPATLSGLVYTPAVAPYGIGVTLAHGFTASKESMDLLAAYLCRRGHGCLTFDFRGHKLGATGGEMHDVAEAVSDLKHAARWARQRFRCSRCVLVGHSMGALVSIAVAASSPNVAGVAAIAVGPEPLHGFDTLAGRAMLEQRADYVVGAEPRRLLRQLERLVPSVRQLGDRPTLFVAARGDVLVRPDRMQEMASWAGAAAEFVEVDGGHLDAPDRARGIVANWVDRLAAAGPGR